MSQRQVLDRGGRVAHAAGIRKSHRSRGFLVVHLGLSREESANERAMFAGAQMNDDALDERMRKERCARAKLRIAIPDIWISSRSLLCALCRFCLCFCFEQGFWREKQHYG
jgi:hypothetical protein